MSQFESFIDDFMIPEDIDKVITEGMTEAGKVLKQNVKSTLSSVSSNNHLANKVTVTKPKKCVNGAYILNTTLKGEVQSGMAASTAAFWLEYGTKNQPARPWVDRATNMSEAQCLEAIQKRYDEAVKGISL